MDAKKKKTNYVENDHSKLDQGFIYCKKSETMPKPKFKMEKLCHGIYSKFGQYYRYFITMYDFNQFSAPIWSWISKWMLGNATFLPLEKFSSDWQSVCTAGPKLCQDSIKSETKPMPEP
jgi:hypothetical protein